MFLSNNLTGFQALFTQQLHDMLQRPSVGAFILVLANSLQDDTLHLSLQKAVKERLLALKNRKLDAPADDAHVFEALCQINLDELIPWQYVTKEPWQLIINPIRRLRPARASQQTITHIQQAFDEEKFHFNKPFLKSEILWEDQWQGMRLRVLYNKFPIIPWHLLIVPEPEQNHPQYLTERLHTTMDELVNSCEHLPGFGLGYNSIGAYASVNHLHFQGFVKESLLPVELDCWQHNGGNKAYPLKIRVAEDAPSAWQIIQELHASNQAYNLLYRKSRCYIMPQRGQIDPVALSDWGKGAIGWPELSGIFTTPSEQISAGIDQTEIQSQLALLCPA